MSAIAMKWAWEAPAHVAMDPTSQLVLLALADRYNPTHRCAWPSHPDIARRTALSERSVRRALDRLEEIGLIRRRPRLSAKGRKIGTLYLFPTLDHGWAAERKSYDFDENGRFDPALAADNREELEDQFEGMYVGDVPSSEPRQMTDEEIANAWMTRGNEPGRRRGRTVDSWAGYEVQE